MQRESSIGYCRANNSDTYVEITYKRRQKRTRLESCEYTSGSCKIPRQGAVSSELDLYESEIVGTGRPKVVQTEPDAVALTRRGRNDFPVNRRLTEFSFYDEDEKLQLVEVIETKKMYISGAILPLEGASGKGKEKGVQCNRFGPILEWSISGFDEGSPVLWISTGIAHYECLEPSNSYKILYDLFFQKSRACIETYRRLSRSYGGTPEVSLNDLVAAVASTMVETSLSHTASVQDLIISWGRFIYEQLIGLEKSESTEDPNFSELPVLISLRDASKKTSFVKSREKTKCLQGSEYTGASGKATKISDSSILTSAEIGKQAARFSGLKNKSGLLSKPQVAEKESDAITLTKIGRSDSPPNRRLTDFTFYDEDGIIQLVDMLEVKNMYVSGLILPLEESYDELKNKGVKCEGFGPILEWSISGFDDGLPIVWISTDVAHYECLHPSIAYKHLCGMFFDKARACVETYRILSNTCGGNPDLSLRELLNAVFQSMSKSENIPQGISIKNLIISWGGFIYEQLQGLEKSNSDEDPTFGELPVLVALRDASAKMSDIKTGNKKRQIISFNSSQYVIAFAEIGKQAALFAGLKYKSDRLLDSSRIGESTRHRLVERESDAIRFTKTGRKDSPPNRQLTDFIFYDKDGTLQLVDMLELKDIYASGFIFPLGEAIRKEKDSGVKCEGFGPILSWSISGFDEGSPIIWVSTDVAHYECLRPAATYKNLYNLFLEKARACIMTYRLLSKSYGGNPDLSLSGLLNAVVHSMRKSKNIPKGTCIKNLIVLWGRFIHDQLTGLEKSESEEDPIFGELPALIALRNASMRTRTKETRLESSKNLTVFEKVEEPSAPFASLNYRSDNSRIIEYRKLQVVEEELDALTLTKTDPNDSPPNRRLIDFSFYDADDILQPVEMLDVNAVYVTGIILPLEEASNKVEAKGAKCEEFGPISEWSISGFDEGSPVIWISTDVAHYECLTPAPAYKRLYSLLFEKARACVEAYRRLSKSCGGNDNLTLNELIAALVRSMSKSGGLPTGTSIKELIASWGWFIYEQLAGLENPDCKEEPIFGDLPVLIALRDASLRILDSKTGAEEKNSHSNECAPEDDIKTRRDRLLQEKKNWLAYFKPNKRLHPALSPNNYHVKISEDEIADDYPVPAYYKTEVQERDEYTIFDEDTCIFYPDQLPHSSLHNWSVYNSERKMISLELLPMKSCPGIDMTVYGSGTMTADDGSGFYLQDDNGPSSSKELSIDATPVFLSAIKEWRIEFKSVMFYISIRTDMSWYRLGNPSEQYTPWLKPVLRTSRLAIAIITLLKLQSRACCLSFLDVIKKVSQFDKSHPGHISSDLAAVRRYILVHGQIILQLFSEYPDITISKCAFVCTLRSKMEEQHQSKWSVNKSVIPKQEPGMNFRAFKLATISKRKAMPATTTELIRRIWRQYCSNHMHWESTEENILNSNEDEAEENERKDLKYRREDEILKLQKCDHPHWKTRSAKKEIRWDGESVQRTSGGEALFTQALANGHVVCVGHTVVVRTSDSMKHSCICFIEYMFQSSDNRKLVHGRLLLRGCQTVLGDTASERELFLTNDCREFELGDVIETMVVEIGQRPWHYQHRKANADNDKLEKQRAWKRKIKGLPMEYFCRSLYWPERGAFFCLPTTVMGLGTGDCNSCKMKQASNVRVFKLCTSTTSFTYRGIQYSICDFLYLSPLYLAANEKQKTTFKNSRNIGLKSYIVCQLLGVESDNSFERADPECVMIKVRRFFKPEDISKEKAFFSDVQEVYYSEQIIKVPVAAVEGKCNVKNKKDFQFTDCHNSLYVFEHVFFCQHLYDTENGTLKQLPRNVELGFLSKEHIVQNDSIKNEKVKCIEGENKSECTAKAVDEAAKNPLATLDIFAGCGGLSTGLKESGISVSKWAIDYEEAETEAFKLNHSEAVTITSNCNAILRLMFGHTAIMIACGDGDECISSSDAAELASKLDEKVINSLPRPGEVDFIVGGPPCQGFSGLNRFQESYWSRTQCEMILSYLSYVDYFRPKYVLLENVRNFVRFDKGKMFHLTLASLLEMGYQVRFGVLEGGAYGIAQTRKRAFIWAACPEATLPEWPEPMHVFSGPELRIQLDSVGNAHYTAVRSTAGGAPFRAITVRDTIADLPAVRSGASATTMEYEGKPLSWFQKRVRGDMVHLIDHISKEMNQLNLTRCQKIPKCPGADWRDLPCVRVQLSNGKEANLVPQFLKNTAKTHNEWKGLFGRLDWEGNFPTAITDPTPGGKVGMCFHPEQDRIISVRECARSQGFPDSYKFSGSILHKHRQVGNAVPPPLAFALGRKLREAIEHNLYHNQSTCNLP
nr:DNA (cytosine-5)-methyltransferase 1B-like [Ipomoea batatas]